MIHAYEAMLMEVKLYDNLFSHNYEKLQRLATDNTWSKTFWQYANHLQIEVCLHKEYHTEPIREGGMSLMEAFIQAGYSGVHLVSLNRV